MKKLLSILFYLSIHFSFAQNFNITGTIKSINNTEVTGANVALLNTNFGTIAKADGSFELVNIPSGNYILRISAVGYATVLQKVKPINNENITLNIELQNENKSLDEVVVTAQKTEEQAQRIPVAITTISSKQVQDYRLWNSKDISAIVPNLYSGNSGDERNVTSIRGITSTSYDPAVSTYIDGVNQFSLKTYIAQLIDVERIEVLRGPQGTLYGRNAMGGVINIITRQPTNAIKGFAEMNFGSQGQQRYALGFRAPLIKDKLFFGFSVLYEHRDGFYHNNFNNTSFEKFENITGNLFLKYILSKKWDFTLNIKPSDNTNKGSFPLVIGNEALNNPFELNQNAISKTIDKTRNASLAIRHFGNYIDFTSTTAYQSNYRYYEDPIDADFSPKDIVTIINNYGDKWNKTKVVTQEFKLSSAAKNNNALTWTAGSYLYYQQTPVKQATHLGLASKSFINTSNSYNAGYAFFGQATYSFNKKLDLTLGTRYDYENKKQSVMGEKQKDGQNAVIIRPDTVSSVNFNAFSPKASLTFHATDNNHLYISYAKGFRAGGLLNDYTTPLYVYNPEYSNNFELGIKNNFLDNRLQLNLTGFFININNAQTPTLILPQAITITKNAGNVESKGVELELLVKPIKGLQIDYNFGYNDAKYKSLHLPNGNSTAEVNYDGNQQIFTPSHTSMLAIQYSYNIGGVQNLQLVARGEWRSLGKQYFDLKNTISQDAYNIFNTRFGVSAKNFEIMFWGRNLSDTRYIEYAYSFGGIHLGNPYNYGATLSGKF